MDLLGFLGKIHLETSDTDLNTTFLSISNILETSGIYTSDQIIAFSLSITAIPYESYYGEHITVKYILRVTVEKNLLSSMLKEFEVVIVKYIKEPAINPSVRVEAGYEDAVQLQVEMAKVKFHNKDVVLGRVYFHMVRVRVVYVAAKVIKQEVIGSGKDARMFNKTIGEYEILDGQATKGDSIPIRIFLKSAEVTPSYYNLCNQGAVKYFICLYIRDEDERSFSKSLEITIWRNKEKVDRTGIPSFRI